MKNEQLTCLPSCNAEAVLYKPSGNEEGGSLTVFREPETGEYYVPSKEQ